MGRDDAPATRRTTANGDREGPMAEQRPVGRMGEGGNWPRYDAAVFGFRNYWYPVLLSGQVGRKPRAITVCGEKVVLVRDQGKVYGLHDRCPHRGVPLSCG